MQTKAGAVQKKAAAAPKRSQRQEPDPLGIDALESYYEEPALDDDPLGETLSAPSSRKPLRSKRKSKTKRRKAGRSLNGIGGPVWTLILALISLPVNATLIFIFRASYERSKFNAGFSDPSQSINLAGIISILLAIGFAVLVVAMIVAGVFAILEMVKSQHMGLPILIAAIISCVVLVMLLALTGLSTYKFVSISNADVPTGMRLNSERLSSNFYKFLGVTFACAIVPAAIAITGFCRNMKSSDRR